MLILAVVVVCILLAIAERTERIEAALAEANEPEPDYDPHMDGWF